MGYLKMIFKYIRLCCITFFFIFFSLTSKASFVEIQYPITSDFGTIAGFTTEDPNLVYMVPRSWKIYRDNFYRSGNDFFFILAPTYDTETLAKYKLEHPETAIVPIPHILSETTLFLGETDENEFLLGKIQHSVTPDQLINQSDIIYYRISVDADVVDGFINLVSSSIGLNGYLNLSYPFSGQQIDSQIPLFIKANNISQILPDNYSILWLHRLMTEYCLLLDDFIDKEVSLGTQSVHLESTDSMGCWLENNIHLFEEGSGIYTVNAIDSFTSNIVLVANLTLVEFSINVEIQIDAAVAVTLDVNNVEVLLNDFFIQNIVINSDTVGSFLKSIIINEIEEEEESIRQSISEKLTEELRIRIINGNIFE